MRVLVYPGAKSDVVSLQEILRLVHDGARVARQREIDERTKSGAPLIHESDGSPLLALPEHVDDPGLAGIKLRFVQVDDATRRGWNARATNEWQRVLAASKARDSVAMRDADEALCKVYEETIAAVVDELHGIDLGGKTLAEAMPGLRLAGLLVPLHDACRHFLGLSPEKAGRCGLPSPST